VNLKAGRRAPIQDWMICYGVVRLAGWAGHARWRGEESKMALPRHRFPTVNAANGIGRVSAHSPPVYRQKYRHIGSAATRHGTD
jgi:hypothetical protein